MSLENTKNIEQIEEKTNKIANSKLNKREKSYLNQYIIYFIGNKYGENEKDKILNKINKNVKEEKSMLSDVLDQIEARGEARGKACGEKIGEARGARKIKKEIAKKLLKRGMPKEEVEQIVNLDIKELENF